VAGFDPSFSPRCGSGQAGERAGLPAKTRACDHGTQRRRHQRCLHACARRPVPKANRSADRRRKPARRRAQYRRASLRGRPARRLHHLPAAGRDARLQPIPVQEARVRCERVRPDHQCVLRHRRADRQFVARGALARRSCRGVESQARNAELHVAGDTTRVLHGDLASTERRRPRPGALQGRGGCRERHHGWIDADCVPALPISFRTSVPEQ